MLNFRTGLFTLFLSATLIFSLGMDCDDDTDSVVEDSSSSSSEDNGCDLLLDGKTSCINFDPSKTNKTLTCDSLSGTMISSCTTATHAGFVGFCVYQETDTSYNHSIYYYDTWNDTTAQSHCANDVETPPGTWY